MTALRHLPLLTSFGLAGVLLAAGMRPAFDQEPRAVVTIKDFKFKPAVLSVRAGTVVIFTNADNQPHSVVASNGSFNSQAIASGKSFSVAFKKGGTLTFFCGSHQFMEGRVIVIPGQLAGGR